MKRASHGVSERALREAKALADERYATLGVDTELALQKLAQVSLSLHCWQGDDVSGFEDPDGELSGGLAVTGNYPGRARSADELRQDLDMVYGLLPGQHRLNLHAIYLEADEPVARNEIAAEHFAGWLDWAGDRGHGLDFNPTCFSHPMAQSGFTLSSADEGVRAFWIEHCVAARKIGEAFGRELGTPCVTNIWIPDGLKDGPADRKGPRERLLGSLDRVFTEPLDPRHNLDSVESKLFGLGSESFVVGSHEFYLGYAQSRRKLLCLDTGHFHPTETVTDKLSAVMLFLDEVLLHLSRGVRWDSDHVVTLSDDLRALMQETVRGGYLQRVHLGLDFFDASINRVAAWVLGARSVQKALLVALLEPSERLRELELAGDYTGRLALSEELKTMPFGAVWDEFCCRQGVPVGMQVLDEVRAYEAGVLARRG